MPRDIPLVQLGLFAGLLVMASTMPDAAASIFDPELARPSKVLRDAMACAGNLLWVLYGLRSGAFPIVLFCSLAALMLTLLVTVQLLLRLPRLF